MTKEELRKVLEALENQRPFGRNHDESLAIVRAYLDQPESQNAVHAAMWRAHVGKLNALIAFCPTCCEGKIAIAEMTRDEVIFQCGIVSSRNAAKRAEFAKLAVQEPLTKRELELIDGMIEVQIHHAAQCDNITNRTMAEKQKGWDMERVELLRKLRGTKGKNND